MCMYIYNLLKRLMCKWNNGMCFERIEKKCLTTTLNYIYTTCKFIIVWVVLVVQWNKRMVDEYI